MGPHGIMSNTDRMRFFNEYRAQNCMSREKGKALIAATLKKTAQRLDMKTRIRPAMKRSLQTNYRYLRVEAGDLAAVFVRSFCREAEPLDFLGKIDAISKEGQILKDDRDCLVCRLKWNGRDIMVRQYKHKGFVFSLRDTAVKSPAKRNWLNGARLRTLNMPVPETLAFIERQRAASCGNLTLYRNILKAGSSTIQHIAKTSVRRISGFIENMLLRKKAVMKTISLRLLTK